jgi:hypothetical protein
MSEKREGAKLVELLHLALLQVMPSYLPLADPAPLAPPSAEPRA